MNFIVEKFCRKEQHLRMEKVGAVASLKICNKQFIANKFMRFKLSLSESNVHSEDDLP